jgi:hypothetical protein
VRLPKVGQLGRLLTSIPAFDSQAFLFLSVLPSILPFSLSFLPKTAFRDHIILQSPISNSLARAAAHFCLSLFEASRFNCSPRTFVHRTTGVFLPHHFTSQFAVGYRGCDHHWRRICGSTTLPVHQQSAPSPPLLTYIQAGTDSETDLTTRRNK